MPRGASRAFIIRTGDDPRLAQEPAVTFTLHAPLGLFPHSGYRVGETAAR